MPAEIAKASLHPSYYYLLRAAQAQWLLHPQDRWIGTNPSEFTEQGTSIFIPFFRYLREENMQNKQV